MTDEQKTRIFRMREQGMSYDAIAESLSLSKNTVKSYCRRNNLSGRRKQESDDAKPAEFCPNCGKPVRQIPGRKHIRFCSSACRQEWWNSHLDQVNRKAVYEYTCAYCGRHFTAYGNSHRKYCSHACYIADRFGGDPHE
ncbi:MAG: RNA polymerase subunit sigma-70 [Lachnospiraceae bacterium]|jgi:endogenous inhibitor of DNA gyrase (YacG/DUF329 family)|nr:RNA polymerase subunit sigma-70 [Lachnospiraceae bacterium]